VTNPFDDEYGIFHVLINDEGQHSLWPSFIEVPAGWTIIHKSDSRAACLEFVNKNWTDRAKLPIRQIGLRETPSNRQCEHAA
jgi:MbtH protein